MFYHSDHLILSFSTKPC